MSKLKNKSFADLVNSIRKFWDINPRTRVQDNKKKNKKKQRQEGKKVVKNYE